ncbi:phage holin family protein, partial [Enterocloster bolteae]|uniref:phage holin family protein n=1 Tax=Enterocloster bolteae TaxID=208479 RepID=UPI00210E4F86
KIPDEWIPVIMAVVGGILGALGMGIIPDFPASDYITAVAVGAVSGLAATGVNQMYKQMNK